MTETITSAEQPRLQAIERYELAQAPHDPALDDIARLAAQLCNAPAAAITLIEHDIVSIPGRFGIDIASAPRNSLPCETTISADGIYQIPDARRDPSFSPGGIPVGDRRYRFYAGAPILTPQSVPIGCLCVFDTAARKLTSAQLDSLESLSHAVTTRLELILRVREMDRAARGRQRVETALTVERNFVSAVLDTVGALVVVFDTAGRIVRFNRACEIISGYESADLVGKFAWERLIPEGDVANYIESFERIRSGDFPVAYENHWVASDGTLRRISWSATALVDSQGQVAFVIATGIDVTVQRVAETAIRESEARYRQIVEGSLGIICTHDLEGRILSINQHGARGIGRSVQDLAGHNLAEFLFPGSHDSVTPYFNTLTSVGEAQGLLHLRHTSGEERVIAYRNRLVEPIDGPRYVLAFGVDITEQIRAEEQLRSLIRQSNSVLESVGDGIWGMDLEGRVTVVNPAAAQMLGYRPEELLGRNMHQLIHHTRADGTPNPSAESPINNTLSDLDTVRISNEIFWRKDGTSFPVEYVARPQIETSSEDPSPEPGSPPGGKAVGVVVAFTDTTERRALDRMKDEFISTVSHELRTPLTSLRAALGLITGGSLASRPEKLQQMLDIATGNTDRLVRLVNDILELERIGSGKTELHYTMCSADDLFRRAAGLQQTGAAKAQLRITFNSQGVNVWADPDRVLQTLTNLISNAIKFSPPGGEIHLRSRRIDANEAEIQVRDRGRGIPEDKLESIFERFHQVDASDSRTMGGTGLGLAICRSIVAQHGGRIWATSTLGQGSTLHFTLPTRPASNLL
jgi:two-component system sensor histidine kinase VicK